MKKIAALSSLLVVFGCASSPDVRPGMDGIHSVSVRGEVVKDTETDAHRQAKSYCKDLGKTVEFLSNDTVKATPEEVNMEKNLFKETESVATDIKFKCN